jgi:hypothetical protein
VDDTEDLNHVVRCDPVNDQVPRSRHPILGPDEPAHEAKMENPNTGNAGDLARTWKGRGLARCRRRCEDQAMIPGSGGNAPPPGAVYEEVVDPSLGVADQSIGH